MSLQQIPGHYIVSASATATGGGSFSAMYNTAVNSGSGFASATASVTGVQKSVPVYDYETSVLQPVTSYINYHQGIYASIDWSSVSAEGAISSTDVCVEIPNMNYNPDRVSAFAAVYDPNYSPATFLVSSVLFGYYELFGYQLPLTVSGSIAEAFSDFGPAYWENYSQSWADTTKLCFGYLYDYGSIDTATSLGVTATIGTITGYEYPYPDRPTAETVTFTASASAREAYNKVDEWYVVSGSISNGLTYNGRLGFAPAASTAAAIAAISSQKTAYFPSTAYTTTMQSAIVSSSQSGLF